MNININDLEMQEWEMEELKTDELAELSDAILAWCGIFCAGKKAI